MVAGAVISARQAQVAHLLSGIALKPRYKGVQVQPAKSAPWHNEDGSLELKESFRV